MIHIPKNSPEFEDNEALVYINNKKKIIEKMNINKQKGVWYFSGDINVRVTKYTFIKEQDISNKFKHIHSSIVVNLMPIVNTLPIDDRLIIYENIDKNIFHYTHVTLGN